MLWLLYIFLNVIKIEYNNHCKMHLAIPTSTCHLSKVLCFMECNHSDTTPIISFYSQDFEVGIAVVGQQASKHGTVCPQSYECYRYFVRHAFQRPLNQLSSKNHHLSLITKVVQLQ